MIDPETGLPARFANRIRLRAAVYVERENQVLLVHDPVYRHGCWILPGGGAKFGETIIECAIRETKEETGIDIKPTDVWRFREIWEPENKIEDESVFRKSLEMIFIGTYLGGDIRLPSESGPKTAGEQVVKDCRWIDARLLGAKLDGIPIYPQELFSARQRGPISGVALDSLCLPTLNLRGKQ